MEWWRGDTGIRTPECRETESVAALRRPPEPPASMIHQRGAANATKSNNVHLNMQGREGEEEETRGA